MDGVKLVFRLQDFPARQLWYWAGGVGGHLVEDGFSYQLPHSRNKNLHGESASRCITTYGPEALMRSDGCPKHHVAVDFSLVVSCFFCLTTAPTGMWASMGWPMRGLREQRLWGEWEGQVKPLTSLKPSSSFKVEKNNNEEVEREAGGEEISLPPHYSLLTVNSQLWPAQLPPSTPLWPLHLNFSQPPSQLKM